MARFINIPDFGISEGDNFVLRGELVYSSDVWPEYVVVPEGFQTDFASIPRVFRPIHPVNGKHRLPAVVHDSLVRERTFDRRLADRIFLEAMRVSGVKRWRRYQMYWAVALITLVTRWRR